MLNSRLNLLNYLKGNKQFFPDAVSSCPVQMGEVGGGSQLLSLHKSGCRLDFAAGSRSDLGAGHFTSHRGRADVINPLLYFILASEYNESAWLPPGALPLGFPPLSSTRHCAQLPGAVILSPALSKRSMGEVAVGCCRLDSVAFVRPPQAPHDHPGCSAVTPCHPTWAISITCWHPVCWEEN